MSNHPESPKVNEEETSGFKCRDYLCHRDALLGSYYCEVHDDDA